MSIDVTIPGRYHALLFISEHSRLPVLLPVRQANRLASAFPAAVCEMLSAVGAPTQSVPHGRVRGAVA